MKKFIMFMFLWVMCLGLVIVQPIKENLTNTISSPELSGPVLYGNTSMKKEDDKKGGDKKQKQEVNEYVKEKAATTRNGQ